MQDMAKIELLRQRLINKCFISFSHFLPFFHRYLKLKKNEFIKCLFSDDKDIKGHLIK